jgi:hypothetical protein
MSRKKNAVDTRSPLSDHRLLTTAEFCRLFAITQRTAQRWRRSGHGPEWIALTDGNCAPVRYLEKSVLGWLQRRRDLRIPAEEPNLECHAPGAVGGAAEAGRDASRMAGHRPSTES